MRLFYKDLYSSECTSSDEARAEFLSKIRLPSLSEQQKVALCRPVTKDEVVETISTLKGGKAPAPDGFGSVYYKKYSKILVGPLTDMYSASFNRGCLPPSLNLANISVILKKEKPPDVCSSDRPISLIPIASKLLSKLLARQLENFLPLLLT